MADIKINTLPTPTWNWLKVNDVPVSVPEVWEKEKIKTEVPPVIREEGTFDPEMESGAGREFTEMTGESGIAPDVYTLPAGKKAEGKDALKVNFSLRGEKHSLAPVGITAQEGSRLTAVMDFEGDGSDAGTAAADIRIRVERKAEVTLVQIFRTGKDLTLIDGVGVSLEEDAVFHLVQIVLDAPHLAAGAAVNLKGEKSRFSADTGYVLKNQDRLDLNYVARHRGKNTETRIRVNGVLRQQSAKTFRGTIDFIHGCAGAVGDERENVLLMDPGVDNKTVPLILCAEEDVEGTHGASIGKISDDVLFYLESRGIPELGILEMLAKSRISAVAGRIPDPEIRQEILQRLAEDTAGEEDA